MKFKLGDRETIKVENENEFESEYEGVENENEFENEYGGGGNENEFENEYGGRMGTRMSLRTSMGKGVV